MDTNKHVEVPGWSIFTAHHSAFVRTFQIVPNEQIDVDYATAEKRKGRWIDATYDARVLGVYVRHQWDEAKQQWWSAANVRTHLINPATNEPYRSGWRDGVITVPGSDDEVSAFVTPLIEATKPRTRITVIEEQS